MKDNSREDLNDLPPSGNTGNGAPQGDDGQNDAPATPPAEHEHTALAKTAPKDLPGDLRGFGNRDEIASMKNRLIHMIPGAAEVPPSVVMAVAQLSVAYGLSPFTGEIYLANMGSKRNPNWQPIIGIKGLRKKARERSDFMTESRVMSAEEVKVLRGEMYRDEDVGVEVKLWRLDTAAKARMVGLEPKPVVGIGFWRKCAYIRDEWEEVNGKWKKTGKQAEEEDSTPNTWTRQQVAEKRAEASAIKRAFDMHFGTVVAEGDALADDVVIVEAGRMLAAHERETAMPAEPKLRRESDGDILWASE